MIVEGLRSISMADCQNNLLLFEHYKIKPKEKQ